MQTIQIVIELLSKNGISAAKMCGDLGFSSGLFYQWKKGSQNPSTEKLSKMANYFNVSTDYLLGNEQKNKAAPNRDSLIDEAIEIMDNLPQDLKAAALAQLKALAALSDKKQKK